MKNKYILNFIILILISHDGYAQNNTWNFGAEKGYTWISGEVSAESGSAFGFYVDKPLTNYFSTRLNVGMGITQGLDKNPSENWLNHPVWNGTMKAAIDYSGATTDSIYANFQNNYQEGSLQGIFTFSELPFFKNKQPFGAFLIGGIGLMRYQTAIDAIDTSGAIYDFSQMNGFPNEDDFQKIANLTSLMDGNFETIAKEKPSIAPLFQIGGGVKWKVHQNITLAVSHRVSFTTTDELDTYQWNDQNVLNKVNDVHHYTTFGINYTFIPKLKPPKQVIEIEEEDEWLKVDLDLTWMIIEAVPIIDIPKIIAPKIEDKAVKEIVQKAFDNLEFETSKAVIQTVSYQSLNKLADLLLEQSRWKLQISGHTDNVGNPAANMELSKKRAEAIRDYLINRGIAMDRFIVAWYGETQPIADNNTELGKQKNRRVELKIVD